MSRIPYHRVADAAYPGPTFFRTDSVSKFLLSLDLFDSPRNVLYARPDTRCQVRGKQLNRLTRSLLFSSASIDSVTASFPLRSTS